MAAAIAWRIAAGSKPARRAAGAAGPGGAAADPGGAAADPGGAAADPAGAAADPDGAAADPAGAAADPDGAASDVRGAARAAGGEAVAATGAPATGASADAASTSARVMAPSGPEPVRRPNAMPRSAASRRAAGEAATCKATPTGAAAVRGVTGTTAGGAAGTRGFAAGDATAGKAATGAAGAATAGEGAAGAAAAGGTAAGATTAGVGAAVGAGCPAAPVSSRAITVPTGNFVPTGTTSSDTTPGLNTSISIAPFCVSTTAMTSPRLTRSPGFTSHSTSVPASMSAPRDGMRKSVIGCAPGRAPQQRSSPPAAAPPLPSARRTGSALRPNRHAGSAHRD